MREQMTFYHPDIIISPRVPDYATRPIQEGFDWQEIMREIPQEEVYVVAFRSTKLPEADDLLLNQLDNLAHEEAKQSPGLFAYFQGEATEAGNCLSFCVWNSAEDARRGSNGSNHTAARQITGSMYESYQLERYSARKLSTHEDIKVIFERK